MDPTKRKRKFSDWADQFDQYDTPGMDIKDVKIRSIRVQEYHDQANEKALVQKHTGGSDWQASSMVERGKGSFGEGSQEEEEDNEEEGDGVE